MMIPPLRSIALVSAFVLSATAATPAPAAAEVKRCTGEDGTPVFTDRSCAAVGGVKDPVDQPATDGRVHYRSCARNVQDLVYEMTSAIDSRDTNRLASVYHWVGMSGREGYGVLSRLEALARQPLVDIVPVMAAAPDSFDGSYYIQTTVRQSPVALRVEQTLADSITPATTVFGLRQHFGCWWITG